MAWSEVETRIANPARKAGKKVAKAKKKTLKRKKLSAKQVKFFGTPAQKAALKRKRKAKRANPARAKKRIVTKARKPKRVIRNSSARRKTGKRKNPVPEIISLVMGNPGSSKKKGKKAMATTKKKYRRKTAAASSKSAGRRTKKRMNRAGRRRNPGALGSPMDWIKGGVGVIAGGVGTRVIPQFLGSTNSGGVGYLLNGGAALALAFGTHALTKDRVLTASVAAGGFAALILRIVGDMTPYGSALSLSGFGDYMVSNFVTPQRIVDQRRAIFEVPNGWGGGAAIPAGAVASGADAAGTGNNY